MRMATCHMAGRWWASPPPKKKPSWPTGKAAVEQREFVSSGVRAANAAGTSAIPPAQPGGLSADACSLKKHTCREEHYE
jgi:hypothetical protein